jgi:hypothetical protein
MRGALCCPPLRAKQTKQDEPAVKSRCDLRPVVCIAIPDCAAHGALAAIAATTSPIDAGQRRLREKERDMIGVFVTFRFGSNFDEQAVRTIAETARARFEGMPGLRAKAFTLDRGKREATNFYVWNSEASARAFFTDELRERIGRLYGVRPSIAFVEIAALVENSGTEVAPA